MCKILTEKRRKDLEGEILVNSQGLKYQVLEYSKWDKVLVRFLDSGWETVRQSSDIVRGNIKDPYYRNYYGVGYLGLGKYTQKGTPLIYNTWRGMLGRCYNKKSNRYSRYGGRGVVVSEEWLCLQDFGKWYEATRKSLPNGITYNLDKDLILQGNKVYAKEFCQLIPKELNVLTTSNQANRGSLPVGVQYAKDTLKYRAEACKKYLGVYETVEEAFNVYKVYKYNRIKNLATKYYEKSAISYETYKNLLNYTIEEFPE